MSSSPQCFVTASNTASSCAWHAHVERQEERRAERLRQRLDVRARLVVEIGDRELGAELAERLGAAPGDRVLVGDADDEGLPVLEHRAWNVEGHRCSFPCVPSARARVARDHQFFVGRDHPGGDATLRGRNARAARVVGGAVELDAEPRGVAADALPQPSAVLADARGEHDRVEPAERRGERAELAADPVDEQVDRRLRRADRRSLRASACRSRCPRRPAIPIAGR